ALAAQPAPDPVLKKIAALEARVAALESKNREYKRQLDHAPSQIPSEEAAQVRQANAAIPAPIAMRPQAQASWTGAFWGASAGGAATRSATSSVEQATMGSAGYNTADASGPARNGGGFLDLFAGWNTQMSRVVVGGQLEATAADLNFGSAGARAYTYFNAGVPTGATGIGDYRPQVNARWMASALLRGGVLLDDRTLVYGLGGWTYARFESRNITDNAFYQPNESFSASGPTGGFGIEHQLDFNWRVRAEYRYTKFEGTRTQDQFAANTAGIIQTYSRSTQYDQSMQSGRIGFAYALDPLR
ncbi:outer membrane protein, partial [Bradyrhizobium ottawaense]